MKNPAKVLWFVLVVFFASTVCVTAAVAEDVEDVEEVESDEQAGDEEIMVYEMETITVTGSRIKSEDDLYAGSGHCHVSG